MIHDPEFYILGLNPRTMPRIFTVQTPNYGTKLLYIDTIEHVKINLAASPCHDSEHYSITKCVAKAVSKKIGCRPEWESTSEESIEKCTTMDQLMQYEEEFRKLTRFDQNHISKGTG